MFTFHLLVGLNTCPRYALSYGFPFGNDTDITDLFAVTVVLAFNSQFGCFYFFKRRRGRGGLGGVQGSSLWFVPDALSHYLLVWGEDWMYRTVPCAGPSAFFWWGGIFTQVCSANVTKVSTRTHRAASCTLTWTSPYGSASIGQTRNKQYHWETSSMSL